jgi:hypothetical protein
LPESAAAILSAAEILILNFCGYVVFRRWRYTFSESWAYALMSVLMVFSLLFQLTFITGLPLFSSAVEGLLILGAVGILGRERRKLIDLCFIVRQFLQNHPAAGLVIIVAWLYLALTAFCIPPETHHWDLLSRTLTILQTGAWSGSEPSILRNCGVDDPMPLNTIVLPYLFLRHQTDLGVGLIGCMAYMSIGFSTYALSRRYAWPPTAIIVTLIVLSMPRFVLLASTPGFEIVPGAVALFCLLAAYRAIESPNLKDLFYLIWGILFSIHACSLFLAVPAILLPLTAILLFRRHGFNIWWKTVKSHRWQAAAAILPAVIFSQVWLVVWTRIVCRIWVHNPPTLAVVYNPDGIQGALANIGRYLLQSAHLTQPVDRLLYHTTGLSLSRLWEGIHALVVQNVFGQRGAALPFQITWTTDERICWFGPFGFLLVLPAIAYAVSRAPRRLKSIAVAASGYFFLIALVPAWRPENVRFFDFFFVCGGFCTAFFLSPWRVSARGRRVLQFIGTMLLLYAAAFNHFKPALGFDAFLNSPRQESLPQGQTRSTGGLQRLLTGSIWWQTRWGSDRLGPARHLFGDDRVEQVLVRVPQTAKLWVIAAETAHAYPFLLRRSSAAYLPVQRFALDRLAAAHRHETLYLLFADRPPPDLPPSMGAEILWRTDSETAPFGGALIRING